MAATSGTRKRSAAAERKDEPIIVEAVRTNNLGLFRYTLPTLFASERLEAMVANRRWSAANETISTLGRAFTVAMDLHLLDFVNVLDEVVLPQAWMDVLKLHASNWRTNDLVFNPSDIYIAIETQDLPFLALVFRRGGSDVPPPGNLLRRVWLPRTTVGGHYDYEEPKPNDFFVPYIRHMDVAVFLLAQTGRLLTTSDSLDRLLNHVFDTQGVKYVELGGGVDQGAERQAIPRLQLDVLAYILDHSSVPLLTYRGEPLAPAAANDRVQWDFLAKAVPEAVRMQRVDYYKLVMTSSLWKKSGFDKDQAGISSHFMKVIDCPYHTMEDLEFATQIATFQVEQLGVDWSAQLGNDTASVEAMLRNNTRILQHILRVSLSAPYVAYQLELGSVHGQRFVNLASVLASQPYIPTLASVIAARAAFPAGVVLHYALDAVEGRVEALSAIYRRVALLLRDAAVFVEPGGRGYVVRSEAHRLELQQLARRVLDRAHAAEPAVRETVDAALGPFGIPSDVSQLITEMRYQRRRRRPSVNSS